MFHTQGKLCKTVLLSKKNTFMVLFLQIMFSITIFNNVTFPSFFWDNWRCISQHCNLKIFKARNQRKKEQTHQQFDMLLHNYMDTISSFCFQIFSSSLFFLWISMKISQQNKIDFCGPRIFTFFTNFLYKFYIARRHWSEKQLLLLLSEKAMTQKNKSEMSY